MPADAIIMRLRCNPVRETSNNDGKYGEDVELWAVWDPDPASPNHTFSKATPSATLKAHISNPDAFDFFASGVEYDVVLRRRS